MIDLCKMKLTKVHILDGHMFFIRDLTRLISVKVNLGT